MRDALELNHVLLPFADRQRARRATAKPPSWNASSAMPLTPRKITGRRAYSAATVPEHRITMMALRFTTSPMPSRHKAPRLASQPERRENLHPIGSFHQDDTPWRH